jgi:HSP20 family protein
MGSFISRPRVLLSNPSLGTNLYSDLETDWNNLFQRFFSGIAGTGSDYSKSDFSYPRVNIEETSTHFIIRYSVPGRTKEDLILEYLPAGSARDENGVIVHYRHGIRIKGAAASKNQEKTDVKYRHRELYETSFSRTIILPDTISGDDYSASLENGILSLSWKKLVPDDELKEKFAPRRLTID